MKKKLTHKIKNFYEENKTEIQVAVVGALMFAGGMYLGYRKCDLEWEKVRKAYFPLMDKQIEIAKKVKMEALNCETRALKDMGQLGEDILKDLSGKLTIDENTKCLGTLVYFDAEEINK